MSIQVNSNEYDTIPIRQPEHRLFHTQWRRLLLIVVVALGQFLAVRPAFPDETVSVDSGKIDTLSTVLQQKIVVRANRIPLTFFSIPEAVDIKVLDRRERLQSISLGHTLSEIPGIRSYPSGNPRGKLNVDVRGFYGGEQAEYLKVTYDDIPLNNASSGLVDWSDYRVTGLGRIESFKGPSSALHGDFAFGGLIALYSPSSYEASAGNVSLSAGSHKAFDLRLRRRQNLRHGRLEFEVSRISNSGWRDHSRFNSNNILIEFNREKKPAAFSALIKYVDSDEKLPGPLTTRQLIRNRRQQARDMAGEPVDDKSHRQSLILGLDYKREILPKLSSATTLFVKYSREEKTITSTTPLTSDPKTLDYGGEAYFQYEGRIGRRDIRTVIGACFEVTRAEIGYNQINPALIQPILGGKGRRLALSAFIHGLYYPIGSFYTSLGLRYDRISNRFNHQASLLYADTDDESIFSETFSPKVSLGIMAADELSAFISVSGAFKTPTMIHLFAPVPLYHPMGGDYVVVANNSLRPQEGTCYESGIKYQREGRLHSTLAGYYYDIHNEIDFNPVTLSYENIGRSIHRGLELLVEMEISRKLCWGGSLAYSAAVFKGGQYDGNQINGVPVVDYRFDINYKPDHRFDLVLSGRGIDKQYLDQENDTALENYFVFSGALAVDLKAWQLCLKIDNILDQEYNYTGYYDPLISDYKYYPAEPRSFILTLSVSY